MMHANHAVVGWGIIINKYILLVPVLMYGSENVMERVLELGLYRWTTSEDC